MKTKHQHPLFHFASVCVLLFLVASACVPVAVSSETTVQSVPAFDHIVVVTFENKEYGRVIGNPFMPTFNRYAREYTLLTRFYGVTHPSLPNYISMIGGDTFGIDTNCEDCYIAATSLPDLVEASGRTWKSYQEDMETPCGLGSQGEKQYKQKHNPFVYFDPIRLNEQRCQAHVVPLDTLQRDIEAGMLPNYIFITPNMCNNSHDCSLRTTDAWTKDLLDRLIPALEKDGEKYLVVLNWDEGESKKTCCGLPEKAGGRIAVVLISPLVKHNFKDPTPYSHYSLLKTVSAAWDLQYLGHAADNETSLILRPWK